MGPIIIVLMLLILIKHAQFINKKDTSINRRVGNNPEILKISGYFYGFNLKV